MKKFLKTFFKLFIVAVPIILQVVVLVGLATFFGANNYIVLIVEYLFALIALVHVINRNMPPEAKVTWVIVLMVFPLAGVLLYVMFSEIRVSKRQEKRLLRLYHESAQHQDKTDNTVYREELGNYYGQANYLVNCTMSTIHKNTTTQYFDDGRAWWLDLLDRLNKAEKFIFMEYFIIEEGLMWNSILDVLTKKIEQGVEVRLMYDDIGCISKISSKYHKQMRALGIKCYKFNRFVPIASSIHNNRDHRKITVIDGDVGYIGGINLADEYINETKPFGDWKDTAVRICGPAVRDMTIMFLQLYTLASKQQESWDAYMPQQNARYMNAPGFVVPFGDGPKPLYPEQVGEQAYLNIINQSQNYCYITTPYLIIDDRLRSALKAAAMRGVDVKIITPNIPDKKMIFNITRYNYKPLQEAGVKIFQWTPGFIHAKGIVADNIVGIVGTINLDYRSLVHHYECGLWMYKTDAILQLKADMDKTIAESKLQGEKQLNVWQRFVCKIAMIFSPLM